MKKDEDGRGVFSGAVIAGNVAMNHVRTLLQPAALFQRRCSVERLRAFRRPEHPARRLHRARTGGCYPERFRYRKLSDAKEWTTEVSAHSRSCRESAENLACLPGMFFAVQFVSISHSLDHAIICNCGMPDVLLISGEPVISNTGLHPTICLWGLLPKTPYEETIQPIPIKRGDRILLVSDGVLEARSPTKVYFGQARLDAAIQNAALFCIIDEIADSLQNFCQDASQDDDISLAEIPCESEILSDWETPP